MLNRVKESTDNSMKSLFTKVKDHGILTVLILHSASEHGYKPVKPSTDKLMKLLVTKVKDNNILTVPFSHPALYQTKCMGYNI